METWVAQGSQRYGPYTHEQLQEMLTTGQLAPNAQVWVPETKQWINAQEMPGYQRPGSSGWQAPAEQSPGSPGAAPGAAPAPAEPGPFPPPSDSTLPSAPSGSAPYAPPSEPGPYAPPAGSPPYAPPSGSAPYAPPSGSGPSDAQAQAGPYTPPGQTAPYPAPAPYGAAQRPPGERTNSLAIAALAIGIGGLLSLVLAFTIVLAPIPALLGLLAVILGFIGRSQVKKTGEKGGGLAIGGIVTGLLTLIALVAMIVASVVWLSSAGEQLGQEVNRACAEAVRSDLRNAAMTQEVVLLEEQSYTTSVSVLRANGWQSAADSINCASAPLTIDRADQRDYCMAMAGGGQQYAITREGLQEGTC